MKFIYRFVCRFIQRLVLPFLLLTLSGCGALTKIWGEAAPDQKVIVVEGNPLPSFLLIFSDDEAVALQTLDLWKRDLRSTFAQIQGERQDFLATSEIQTLIRRGYLRLSPDPDLTIRKVTGVLRLLGFKDGISKQDVEELLAWLDQNRVRLKTFYRLFVSTELHHNPLTSRETIQLIDLFGSFVGLGGKESLRAAEMKEILNPWIPDTYPHAKQAMESGFDLGIAFFASFCGDRVEADRWNGRKIGQCLQDLTRHFTASAPVFDFIFGSLHPVDRRSELGRANQQLVRAMETWIQGHHHPLFPTARVAQFARQLEIPAPYAFFKLTEWLPKLNRESTPEAFSPTFFIDLARVTQNWIGTFLNVAKKDRCRGKLGFTHADWRTCAFTGQYAVVDQLYNDEYATLIRSKTLGFASKIAFYDSLAGFMMSKIDPTGEELASNGIKELTTLAIRLVDSNAFAFNVVSRLMERPYDPSTAEASLQNVHRQGLAELAALASDLIPERGNNPRSLLKKLTVQIYDNSNRLSYSMDRLGITAFLYIYDLMTSMRAEYLRDYDLPVKTEGPLLFVPRRKIVEAMPRMLHDHFPRLYNECVDWGFERTCGVVFTEILPSPIKGREDLETYEMDMMTLSAVLIESMINRCDRNSNDRIGSRGLLGFDGNTEKSCVIAVATSLTRRLMSANIVDNDPKAQTMMNVIQNIPPARWIAKIAMARGSLKGPGMIVRSVPPVSIFSKSATLGSILSLAAEVIDSDKTRAIDQGTFGPAVDPGDEYLYHDYLTRKIISSQSPVERTSARFKSPADEEDNEDEE